MKRKILTEELAFFEEQKPRLLETHPGQFALIRGRELVGVFAKREDAYAEGFRRFMREPFLVRQIVDRPQAEQIPLLAYRLQRADL